MWRKSKSPFLRDKKPQRVQNQEIVHHQKENAFGQEENPVNKGRWVRFNVDVQNGRHKFADYREVGGESDVGTIDDLVHQFKKQLELEGLRREQLRDQWELRSSRGFKFNGCQRVSSIYKFKEKNEIDLCLEKKQRIGRQHCFERGYKLYKIVRCLDWKQGVFEVQYRDSRSPSQLQRGEAHIQELEVEAKEELYGFMKDELLHKWRA